VVVSAGRKGLREKSKDDEGCGFGKRRAGGPRCGEVLVLAASRAVTSLAELSEQSHQPAVLTQPRGLRGEEPWLLSAGWDGRESF